MAYIGRQQESGTFIKLDSIESQFDGTTVTFNLTVGGDAFFVGNPYSLLVSFDNLFLLLSFLRPELEALILGILFLGESFSISTLLSAVFIIAGAMMNQSSLTNKKAQL